jgi:protein disulfide-isomerase A1
MDATANEVDGVEIRGYPTLKFYSKENKGSPLEYEGERDLDGLKKYLAEKSTSYKNHFGGSKSEL